MRIAVSGANGFVGRALCVALHEAHQDVIALVRRSGNHDPRWIELLIHDDNFASLAAGQPELGRCDVFVHLAARVHVMRDRVADPLSVYRAANVDGALNAARAALHAGARRFVFVSSVKALGEGEPGRPWREDDQPVPVDPYGISKREAEIALSEYGRANGMEIVIVRPPLVYGPGVRANFLSLTKAIQKGIPLPLGAVVARRSMVYVGNLADAIGLLATNAGALDGVFHVTDGNDLSVAEMIQAIADALGRRARIVPVPIAWLRAAGKLLGQSARIERLTGPLRMETIRLREELGWVPPWTVSEGLAEMVRGLEKHRVDIP
ncbi:UDP-glucose 4-epimerase [Trinickia symbiotica]|uniref:Short chain dehydrogenase n=1 Tax=Trinickia symbiotica TaxID=863227 RepID=A0A2N7X5M9_9BURK|nr:NAD-dependent epimerase/dehydratase family protein [Trinickia symbiotica]PMS36927.1 short chain dehydrogenase [Trinickia symbiotica]PPK41404.1 UDP-glucose 4-epimerase [Trinickia symbiotica]